MSPKSSARHCSGPEMSLPRHRVEVNIEPDLPMLRLDAVLFEQVLFNLLDNAAKYSPAGSRIDVRRDARRRARRDRGRRSGPRDPAGRFRTDLRQILPGPGAGSPPCRHRARAGDLPRFCRGAGRLDRCAQPARPLGRGADDPHAGRAGNRRQDGAVLAHG